MKEMEELKDFLSKQENFVPYEFKEESLDVDSEVI